MYSIDSRTIQKNQFFIPIKGENFDGHDFIQDVLQKGGKIVDLNLAELAIQTREKIKATVIGVTGSCGKTTFKDMLHHVLSSKFKIYSTFENQNNEIGAPLTLLNAPKDTEIIIVEMGLRNRGDLLYLSNIIRPELVIITNIAPTHLELLDSIKNVAKGKAEIYQFIKNKDKKYSTVINESTPYFKILQENAQQNGFKIFSIKDSNILSTTQTQIIKTASIFNLTEEETLKQLKTFKAKSSHRQNKIFYKQGIIIDDSYNASPYSMEYSIKKTIIDYPKHKHLFVLGQMKELGKNSQQYHHNLIKLILETDKEADIFCYGDNYANIKDKNTLFFLSQKDIIDTLKEKELNNTVMLIKGSRSEKMENITKGLLE